MLAADSVAINRLQIKGDKRTSQALIRELEQTSWAKPLPVHLQHAWILVRELNIKGKARELRQQTAHHLDSELQHAVRAIHGNAESANVIWFATLPELIAFLLVDLSLGKTTQWYWSRWAYLLKYPRHEAIARLLFENIEHMPAVMAQLQWRQQLALVISQISSGAARTLVRELARICGLQAPLFWEEESLMLMNVSQTIHQEVKSHEKLLAYWRPALKGLDIRDGRLMLAAVLHGLVYTPLWLQQQPLALTATIVSLMCPASTAEGRASNEISPASNTPDGKAPDKKTARASNLIASKVQPISKIPQLDNPAEEIRLQSQAAQKIAVNNVYEESSGGPQPEKADNSPVQKLAAKTDKRVSSPVSTDYTRDPGNRKLKEEIPDDRVAQADYEFFTRAGGFFYLLNPLRELLTPELIATETNASVWHWLLDLYRLFESNFPPIKNFMDAPLHSFILDQLQPGASPHELQQLAQLLKEDPPSEFAQHLFAELELRYQDAEFWQELKNSPGFFAVPARLVATASHWDIYLPLQSVRLDLRLAGWDVNPGWLPWLGRVVALHYVDQLTTAVQEDKL